MSQAKQQPEESEIESTRMGLGEHLSELRTRLMRAAIVMSLGFLVLYGFRHDMFAMVQGPQQKATAMLRSSLSDTLQEKYEARIQAGENVDAGTDFQEGWPETWTLKPEVGPKPELIYLQADGGFFLRMRVCFWLALGVAGPFILWEMWGFIAAGLYKRERKVAYAYFPVSLSLFASGILFGYFVLVPYALYFLNLDGLGRAGGEYQMSADLYLNFLKGLCLALGFVFQLPIVMVALSRLGLVPPQTFSKFRKHTFVAALVMGAILTPPDPVTQILMAGPIVILYELGLCVARFVWRPPLHETEEADGEPSAEPPLANA